MKTTKRSTADCPECRVRRAFSCNKVRGNARGIPNYGLCGALGELQTQKRKVAELEGEIARLTKKAKRETDVEKRGKTRSESNDQNYESNSQNIVIASAWISLVVDSLRGLSLNFLRR